MPAIRVGEVRLGRAVVHVLVAPASAADAAVATLPPRPRLADRRRGVWAAQELARSALGIERAALGRERSGRPFLRDAPGAGISVSHSGRWVAAALCATSPDVGIDVQEPRAVSDALVRMCCTDADRVLAATAAVRARAFVSVWVVQEALAKATGEGLRSRPYEIPVPLAPDAGSWRGLAWARAALPVPLAVAVRADAAEAGEATWSLRESA